MTFFFDNNLAPGLVTLLKFLDVDAHHIRDHFSANAEDTTWLPEVGARGWVLITCDDGILSGPAERAALREHRVTAVFLSRRLLSKGKWEQVRWVVNNWQNVIRTLTGVCPGTCFRTSGNKLTRTGSPPV